MYSFFLVPDCFFYECQMMVNILFHNTNQLGNIPYRQGAILEMTYDFLPDGLFSFIAHTECSFFQLYPKKSILGILKNFSFQMRYTGIINFESVYSSFYINKLILNVMNKIPP